MTTATIIREKKKRGLKSLVNQFDIQTTIVKFSPAAMAEADAFHAVLNRFITDGITFDVSADDFQTIDANRILKTSDGEFLKLNGAAILCHLQQSLLMKHLFSHSPEQFEDFAFEIREREAIFSADCLIKPLSKTVETQYQFYFEAVKSVTKKWFDELLNEK